MFSFIASRDALKWCSFENTKYLSQFDSVLTYLAILAAQAYPCLRKHKENDDFHLHCMLGKKKAYSLFAFTYSYCP